ncbi:MAG: transcriptional repressor DicA [bacterium ADurb.Bin363]|nr:MAG: transcriptional repressor DicA [bacterium ADurb.Bin363]
MIGSRLREFRKAMKFTQKDLAKNLNTSTGYIADIESEKTMPGGQSLALLNKNFNINLNWLLTGKGEMLNRETPGDEYWIQKCISGKEFFKFRAQKRKSQINSLECAINKTRTDSYEKNSHRLSRPLYQILITVILLYYTVLLEESTRLLNLT